jgi:hypothetical protein
MRIWAACCFPLLLAAQSQPPPPSPSEASKGQEKNARGKHSNNATDQRKPDSPPPLSDQFVTKPSGREEQGSQSAAYYSSSGNSGTNWPDWIVAIFTVVLAGTTIGQIILYKRQTRLMRDSLEIASAPRVCIEEIYLLPNVGLTASSQRSVIADSRLTVRFKNYGSTIARAFTYQLEIAAASPFVNDLNRELSVVVSTPTDLYPGLFAERTTATLLSMTGGDTADSVYLQAAMAGRRLTVKGSVSYIDLFGNKLGFGFAACVLAPDYRAGFIQTRHDFETTITASTKQQ